MFLEKAHQRILFPTSVSDKVESPSKPMTAMASEFAPVPQFTASPSQYTLFNSQTQQISPVNSVTATPNNASPTSPRTALPPHLPQHTRQLRPPKSPLYVPAVLRPTDPPRRVTRPSPLTPPQSSNNSFDDLENARSPKRRSTGDGDSGKFGLGAITEAEWSTEGLGLITGLPTREHWKVRQHFFLWSEDRGLLQPCIKQNRNEGGGHLYGRQVLCRNTLMAIACSKKIGCNGETPGTNISQASLGCKPHAPEQKSSITQHPIRLSLHLPPTLSPTD
jgi:hypothetical protein